MLEDILFNQIREYAKEHGLTLNEAQMAQAIRGVKHWFLETVGDSIDAALTGVFTDEAITTKRERIVYAIMMDEREYCFDKTYHDDRTWATISPGKTREQAFYETFKHWKDALKMDDEAFAEEMKMFGDKYDYVQ